MNKGIIIALIIAVSLIGGALLIALGTNTSSGVTALASGVTMEGDTQIIDVTAKGGYAPRNIEAKAGVNTVIRMETRSTFDCSAALTIPVLNVRKMLPPSGVTEFEVPPEKAVGTMRGVCSMGMYSFTINFK
jgi:plastocyanin domain-containing protein